MDGFVRDVVEKRERFVEVAPYSADTSVTAAFNILRQEKVKLAAARKKEGELKQGMDIFNMHQPAYKEMATTEKELEQLDAMWTVAHEWQGSYNGWKDGLFRDLQVSVTLISNIAYHIAGLCSKALLALLLGCTPHHALPSPSAQR